MRQIDPATADGLVVVTHPKGRKLKPSVAPPKVEELFSDGQTWFLVGKGAVFSLSIVFLIAIFKREKSFT